ncbi:alpha/beta hydrolase [Alphaproteobacteria bacterium]|nr:alpha/beta hydrolase [Alphaproteobacteria bacterium]
MLIVNELYKINNVSLEVKLINNNAKKFVSPLVMLHEGLGSVALWKDFPEKLANKLNRKIIVYSRKGMGKSSAINEPRTVNFMHVEAKHYLKNIIEHYCEQEPILFGHSDGASIALIYAGLNTSIHSIIVEAPHLMVEELTIKEISKIKLQWETSNLREKLEKYHDDVDSAFNGWCNIWLEEEFKKWNIEEYIKKINTPLFAIQGEDDQYGSLRHINLLKKLLKKSFKKLIIKNCKHSPHQEYPNLIIERLSKYLTNL